jgi:PAS domain S-box-containing protein
LTTDSSSARGQASHAFAGDLGLLLDATADGIYCFDPDGRTTLCNETFLRMLGFERDSDALGTDLHEIIRHSAADGSLHARRECPICRTAWGGEAHSDTAAFVRRDGASFVVEYRVRPILRDGLPQGAVCSFVDLTDRRRAEAEVARLTRQLEECQAGKSSGAERRDDLIRTFYDHSSECHAVLAEIEGGSFRFEELNPATLDLYGKTRAQVVGHTTDEVFGATQAADLNNYLTACLDLNTTYRYERAQGAAFLEAIATPVPDPTGQTRRVVVTARDTADRRKLEQQLRQAQKMEAVGQLTGGIAHDFNNLLSIIMGNVEALQRRAALKDVGSMRRLDLVMRAAERGAQLTHRLLAFSRRQPLEPKPANVNRLVAGMSDLLNRTLGDGVVIETVLAAGLWDTLIDTNQLESAILNIAVNARDAMPAGGKLTIETANMYLDDAYAASQADVVAGPYVMVALSDTGTGMTRETIAQAFEPFFTTKDVGQGTGLGLSQVYGFVKQSRGHVRIYSEPGDGTTVRLYLPRLTGTDTSLEIAGESSDVPGGKPGETILVVEDDADVRAYSVETLRELGYAVLEAPDGHAALRVLEARPEIDLLFTDVGLPGGLNGRQLVDEARRRHPQLKVLYTTGYARNAIVHQGRLDIGVDLIVKPFTYAGLASRIRQVLDTQ